MKIHRTAILAGTATFALTLGASLYAALLGNAEIIHFWVAAPAGHVRRPTVVQAPAPCTGDCDKCDRKNGAPAAKTGARLMLAPINVDLDRRGALKRWLQPAVEALSTHWIYNVGDKPVRLRMELANLHIPVKWEVNANFPYDERTHTFLRPLAPGASIPNLAIDWVFQIPRGAPKMVYDGGLQLSDADTGAMLTYIPIKIGRGLPAAPRSSYR